MALGPGGPPSLRLMQGGKTESSDSGGGGGDMLGERITRLEVKVDHLEGAMATLTTKADTMQAALSGKIDEVLDAIRPLSSRAYVWWAVGTLFTALGAVVVAVVAYAPQLQKLMTWLSAS